MTLPNRPKLSDAEMDKIVHFFFPEDVPSLLLLAVRGYFLNTVGKAGYNDINVYDDAIAVYADGSLIKTFNANTDPSKAGTKLAMLDTGLYRFYRGVHKGRIKAFRAYPEGVRLPCTRDGVKSYCSAINIHDGGASNTWSAGCQTLPNYKGQMQFVEFRELVYGLMDKYKKTTVHYLLIEEKEMRSILGD